MKKTVCILWLLCTVLASTIAQQTPTTAQIMSKASEYWAKQDYTQAASWYRKAAERGDATAQNCLGNCYFSGKGVDQSDMYALAWYQGRSTGPSGWNGEFRILLLYRQRHCPRL